MDLSQATQLLTWLDEEHRRDKALILELRQKVESQSLEIQDQNRRIQELESQLAQAQARFGKFAQLEEALQHLRNELILLIQQHEEHHKKSEQERAKARQLEQESLVRTINELRRDLETLLGLPERLKALQAEDRRLAEQATVLQNQVTRILRTLDEHTEKFTFAESQRVNDQKKLASLQQDVLELLRRTETHTAKLELLEEVARRNEQNIAALAVLREDLRRDYDQWVEAAKQRDAAREQLLQKWAGEMQALGELAQKVRSALERFYQQQEIIQQALRNLETFKQELNRSVNLISEKQRLAEDRQRQHFEEWVAEQEQRWRKFELERQAKWNQLDARHEEMIARVKALETFRQETNERLAQITRDLLAMQSEYRAKILELWQFQTDLAAAEVEAARRLLQSVTEEARKRLESEHAP